MISRGLKDDLVIGLKRVCSAVDLRDGFVFGGLAAAGYGISMIYPPAAWIFCGVALFWLGVR